MGYGKTLLVAASATLVLTTGASADLIGPDWVESADAGNQIETAQPINEGKGQQLQRIFGSLDGVAPLGNGEDDLQDVYQILVTDPVSLLFSTVDTSTNFQTSLWLFDEEGFGLLGNVFAPDSFAGETNGTIVGSEMQNFATDETGVVITEPGIYYIAICGFGDQPLSGGLPMFFFNMSDEVSGPDDEGGGGMLGGWTGGKGVIGQYEITVQGVGFVPAPGVLPLLTIGLLGIAGRRRR